MRRPGRTGRTTAPVRTPPGLRRARLPLGSGGRACPLAALALALALALAAPAPAAALPFHDVGASTPHRDAIAWLASAGVSEGYPDGTFRPMAPVYRQDMAAFLYRLAGSPAYEPSAADRARFPDVGASTPHAREIWWLASAGVSEGYPDGTFRPMARVCRQDMAAFLRRLARLRGAGGGEPGGASPFPDVVASTPHRDDILWLAWAGISKGYPDGTFRGMSPVYRQDMAAFLRREAAVGTAFDPAEDGPWTEPGDGALTAVLYADGDLVFQYGEGAAPGREALREGPASSRFWSGYGESGLAGEVRSVSSRCAARPAGRSLNSMFYGCGSLSDVSGLATWDVSGAIGMSSMFFGCSSLSDVSGLASWDTSSAAFMDEMFYGCSSLADVSALEGWDTSSVTDMDQMFSGCPSAPSWWHEG